MRKLIGGMKVSLDGKIEEMLFEQATTRHELNLRSARSLPDGRVNMVYSVA